MLSNILNAAAKYNLGIVFSLYQSNIEDILSLEVYCENTNHYTRVIPLEGCKKYKAISVSVMPEPNKRIRIKAPKIVLFESAGSFMQSFEREITEWVSRKNSAIK